MLPLGASWAGTCRALPDHSCQPDEGVVRSLCNLGYARGVCARFPAGEGPDAVRFTISADDGECLRIFYVIERDHLPFSHGPMAYSLSRGAFDQPAPGEIISRQAQAYVASYLRRKAEASAR